MLFAVKAGASGDITPRGGETTSAGVAWSREQVGPPMASPLAYQGLVYVPKRRNGIVTAYDAKTGEEVYKKRVPGAPGFWATPWAADGKVSLLQPEGIALGFDKGPVFDRSLQVATVALDVGDRLVMATTGVVRTLNSDGEELGEKEFYRQVLHGAALDPEHLTEHLRGFLESYAGDEPLPADISIVVVGRES